MLRAEKGYIIVGQDTDGTLTPDDASLDWAIGKQKSDFVGKRSLTRPDIVSKGRKQLVGLLTDDPKVGAAGGRADRRRPAQPKPMTMLGHVTSSYWSDALGRSIAMAVSPTATRRDGETLHVPMPEGTVPAGGQEHGLPRPRGTRLSA